MLKNCYPVNNTTLGPSISGTESNREKLIFLQKEGVNQIVMSHTVGTDSDQKFQKQGSSPQNLPTMPKTKKYPPQAQRYKLHIGDILCKQCICTGQVGKADIVLAVSNGFALVTMVTEYIYIVYVTSGRKPTLNRGIL